MNPNSRGLPQPKFISSSCIIRRGQVFQNGLRVFSSETIPVAAFLDEVYTHFSIAYPRFHRMDPLSRLAFLASERALDGFAREPYQPEDLGVVLSNANSSLDTDIRYQETLQTIPSPALFVYTLPNIMIGEICIRNQFKGENAFFVFKAFDANFMEQYVGDLLDQGLLKACLFGWVDLLQDSYDAAILLAEGFPRPQALAFSAKEINHIYLTTHG